MLEQFGEANEALPVGQVLREHVGGERFPDDGHRKDFQQRLFRKSVVRETGRTSQARDEPVLKAAARRLSARQRESSCAGQSKP
ncbi:hypothetical protein ACVME8_002895 [Bradyrhizobium diazoefficiens]